MARIPQPRYVQVCESVRRSVADGSLKSGDRIPSEVELARELGMARMTVRKGLDILVGEGLLVRRHRRGTFVAEAAAPAEEGLAEFNTPAFLRPRTVTLRIETQDSQAHQLRFWRAAFDAFAKLSPQYRAEISTVAATSDEAGAAIAGDAIATSAWALPHYIERGLVARLSRPVVPADVPRAFREYPEYAVPFSCGAPLLVVNLDLAERAGITPLPKSMDFGAFLKLLRRAARKLRGTCLLNCSPSAPVYVAAGADIESKNGQKRMPARVREVYEALLGLPPGSVVVTGPASVPFKRGEALFFVCSPHALDWDVLPAGLRVAVRPLPIMKRSRPRYMPVVLAVSAASPHPQAAEQLVRFLAGEVPQRLLADHRAGFPAQPATLASLTDDGMPGAAALRGTVQSGKPLGRDARYLIEYLVTVFMPVSRRIMNRERSIDDGLTELASLTVLYHRGEVGWRTD